MEGYDNKLYRITSQVRARLSSSHESSSSPTEFESRVKFEPDRVRVTSQVRARPSSSHESSSSPTEFESRVKYESTDFSPYFDFSFLFPVLYTRDMRTPSFKLKILIFFTAVD